MFEKIDENFLVYVCRTKYKNIFGNYLEAIQ